MTTTDPPHVEDPSNADGPIGVDETADLSGRTATSLGWQYAAALLSAAMQIVYTAVTSRQLTRAEIGLFAAAMVVVNFTRYLSELGVGQALIQKATLTREDVRAGATLGLGLGLVTWVLVALAAGPLARGFFDKPDVASVLRWLAVAFVLTSAQTTAQSILRRRLAFRELAIVDIAAFFFGYILLGCGGAFLGAGVWSLVLAVNGAAAFALVARYALTRHAVTPVRGWEHYAPLLSFGTRISGVNFLNYASNNVDTIAVSRYATEALLGVYNRAFNLVTLSMSYLTQSLQRVLFPSMARIQDDPERLGRVFSGIAAVVSFLLLPISAGIAVAAVEIIDVLLGLPKWDDAVVLLPVLALAGAAQGMSSLVAAATEARAELNQMLAVQLVTLLGMVAGISLVVGGPLLGYAIVLAVGEVVRHGLLLALMRRSLAMPGSLLVRAYVPAVVAAGVTAGAIGLVRWLLAVVLDLPSGVVLVAEIVAGGVAMLALLRAGPVPDVRDELRRRLAALGVRPDGRRPVDRVATLVLGGTLGAPDDATEAG